MSLTKILLAALALAVACLVLGLSVPGMGVLTTAGGALLVLFLLGALFVMLRAGSGPAPTVTEVGIIDVGEIELPAGQLLVMDDLDVQHNWQRIENIPVGRYGVRCAVRKLSDGFDDWAALSLCAGDPRSTDVDTTEVLSETGVLILACPNAIGSAELRRAVEARVAQSQQRKHFFEAVSNGQGDTSPNALVLSPPCGPGAWPLSVARSRKGCEILIDFSRDE